MTAARSPWGWAVAGAVAGVLPAIVAFAPAQWLTQRLGAATGGQVQLTQARGTIWTGSAQLVLTGGGASQDSAALPGRLEWQLRPSWNGLRLQINATCCTPQPLLAQVRVQMGQVRVALQDSRSQWPAAVLAGLGTPWNTLQPQGQLMLQTQGLEAVWSAGRMVGVLDAQLRIQQQHSGGQMGQRGHGPGQALAGRGSRGGGSGIVHAFSGVGEGKGPLPRILYRL